MDEDEAVHTDERESTGVKESHGSVKDFWAQSRLEITQKEPGDRKGRGKGLHSSERGAARVPSNIWKHTTEITEGFSRLKATLTPDKPATLQPLLANTFTR